MIYWSWEIGGRSWGLGEPNREFRLPFESKLAPAGNAMLPKIHVGWLFYPQFGFEVLGDDLWFCEAHYAEPDDVGYLWVGDPCGHPRAIETHIFRHGPFQLNTTWEKWQIQ